MDKIKTYQDFKKYTIYELFDYSNREDLTREESKLFIQFCNKAVTEPPKGDEKFLEEGKETLEEYIKRKVKEEGE